MPKARIASFWLGGWLFILPASVLVPAGLLALAGHLNEVRPGDWGNFLPDSYSGWLIASIAAGVVLAIIGAVLQFSAWLGALVNTNHLEDRTWYDSLLLCGVLAILFTPAFLLGTLLSAAAMIGYLVGGPDTMAKAAPSRLLDKRTIRSWSSWAITAMILGLALTAVVGYLGYSGRPLHGLSWFALALESLGFTVAGVAVLFAAAAWWGAIFNAHRLRAGSWFRGLVWSGVIAALTIPLFGLGALVGVVVMSAFLRSPADGLAAPTRHVAPPPATPAAAT